MQPKYIVLFFFLPLLLPAQWTNLGRQSFPFAMTRDYHGIRFTNVEGSVPSNSSMWTVYGTNDDWVTESPRSTGGGGSVGCCVVEIADFLNDSTGAMVVNNLGLHGVGRTTDGGVTWQLMAQGGQTSSTPIADLQAYSDTVAYLIGHGASSFSALGLRFTPAGYAPVFLSGTHEGDDGRIHFLTDSIGLVIARDSAHVYKVFRTTNGGGSWATRLSVGVGPLRDFEFVDGQRGFVAGHGGVCYQTTDAGFTWNGLAVNGPVDVFDVDFISPLIGYLACGDGVVLRTTDGGISWATDIIDTSLTLVYVKAVTATIAYVMTRDSVLYKRDYVAGNEGEIARADAVRVYPNPSTGEVNIAVPVGDRLRGWRLWDVRGQLLGAGTGLSVDLGGLSSGVYVLELQTVRGLQRIRVMRE